MNDPRVLQFPAHTTVDVGDKAAELSCLRGQSVSVARLRAQISRVAPYFRSVLLTGEAGSGAADVAQMLHGASGACKLPLRTLSAEAAEVFFAQQHTAVKAMLFLEDAEVLTPAAQRGLLRWMRLRGPQPAQVIAAAESDLRGLVSAGRFSTELAGRLGGLRIALPPLRHRREDIAELLEAVAAARRPPHEAFHAEFLQAAREHEWPRNFEELDAAVAWLCEHRTEGGWMRADFEAAIDNCSSEVAKERGAVRMVRLETVVQEHLRAVLTACFGNKQQAASVLGISRSTLYRMLDAGVGALTQAS